MALHVVPLLLVVLSVAHGALLSFPSLTPSGTFRPTTCSGALWEPPRLAGTYNLSIVDKCTKNTHSVFVTVQCPERIPAVNFSLSLETTTTGWNYADITLRGQVCTDRNLAHYWVSTRRPALDVEDGVYDSNLGVGTNDDGKRTNRITPRLTTPGVYQYTWKVYDGCNLYTYNTSVHYDGRNVFLLPPHSLANFETPNPRCASDTPFVRFAEDSKEVVYRVNHGGTQNSGSYSSGVTKFPNERVQVIDTLTAHMNAASPSQLLTSYEWHLTPADDREIVVMEVDGATKTYYIAPRGALPAKPERRPANLTARLDWFDEDSNDYGESSWGTWGTTSYPYPVNRANATFNTPTSLSRDGSELYRYYTYESHRTYEAVEWWQPKEGLAEKSEVPICRVVLTGAYSYDNPLSMRYNEADVVFTPETFNKFDNLNPLIADSACVGMYNLTVVARNGPNCTAAASQAIHVSCGFAPDVRLKNSVQRSVEYIYNPSTEAVVNLAIFARDPFGRTISTTWDIIQKPEGATTTMLSSSTTDYSFRATHGGVYVVNITVSNGCSATSVLEYVEVFCSSTEKPAVTLNDFTPNTPEYSGRSSGNVQSATFTVTTAVAGASGLLAATARLLSGPTPFALDTVAQSASISTSLTGGNGGLSLQPKAGAGTYTVQLNATHGCGQITTVTKQYTMNCNPVPSTFTVASTYTQSDFEVPNAGFLPEEGNELWITLTPSNTNAYAHSYTLTPNLRHTWQLQSINDVAVDSEMQKLMNYGVATQTSTAAPNVISQGIYVWSLGKHVYKYWLDDGCTQKTGTHTVSVICPTTTVTITASASSINSDDSLQITPTLTPAGHVNDAQCTLVHTFGGKEDTSSYPCSWITGGIPQSTGSWATGTHTLKLRVENGCGKVTTSEPVTVTVTCPTLTPTFETHAREANKDAMTAVTFKDGRFPSIVFNATKSKSGEDFTTWSQISVTKAPVGSMFEEFIDEYEWDDGDWSSDCDTSVEGEESDLVYCYKASKLHWKQTSKVYAQVPTWNNWGTFTPDVAGTYEFEVLISNDCSENKRTVSVTAGCPAGDSKAVITNAKGDQVATSTGFATGSIPGVSFTIPAMGSDLLILNGSTSTVSGSSKQLFYHWYWEAPRGDADDSWAYDHDGLLTPYAPVLTIDPKMYPFNNRPLYLTVSDGCSRVTTAVRVNTGCSGPTVNLQVDKTTVFYDPVKEASFPQCPLSVKLHAGGVCVHGNDWLQEVVGRTVTSGSAITANEAFMQSFTVSSQDDDDNEKLAIGLGVGLGLLFLIVIAIVLCMFYRKSNNKSQVLPSNAEPRAATGSVELA